MESTKVYNHEIVKFDERQVVYLKEFIIYEQVDLDKFAVFKFFNNYIEELNYVEFLIKQYDKEGILIAENTLKYSNFKADKKSYFSPYTKLMVEDECHRVEAVLIKATFKTHHFEDNRLSTLKDLDSINKGFKPSRKERNKIKTKKIKNKNKIKYFILAPFLALSLLISVLLTFSSLNNFKNQIPEGPFRYGDFKYYIKNNEVRVDQYLGDDEEIVIEARIFDNKITKISSGVFQNLNVETVTIKADEIEIGDNAFKNCKSLRKISTNKVTNVGDYAFYGCEKLTNFNFKKTESIGKFAFANTGITKLESETLISIGDGAFENCNIVAIDVINADMGNNVFSSELKIEKISIADFNGSIGSVFGIDSKELADHFETINLKPYTINHGDFDGIDFISPKVNIDFSNATIEYRSMKDYFNHANIDVIDTGRSEIVDNVLISIQNQGTTNLTNSLIGNNTITSISPGVIAGISSSQVKIDIDGVKIDEKTLSRATCTILEIGKDVLVDNDAFKNNETIEELYVYGNPKNNYSKALKGVKKIEKVTVLGSLVPEGYFENLTQLKTVKFEQKVELEANVFSGCTNLVNIDFDNIIVIGDGAFKGCEKITSIPFNQNIESIGKNAFKDCKNLYDISSLPLSVNINNAFTGENNITDLVIYNYGKPLSSIGDFNKLENLVIKENYNYSYLVSNLVSGFDKIKTLELPYANQYQDNIINNCKNLKFITLYSDSNCDRYIGNGCDSLYYVTINGNINVPYNSFNKSANKTKNLYINGTAESSFDLVELDNIQYIKINQTNVSYFGQLYGAPNLEEQNDYVPASLKTVEIGNSRINAGFFYGCSYIHNIILPNALSVNMDALSGLNSIRNVYFGSSALTNTNFTIGFNDVEHVYKPNILGNSLVLQNLKSELKNVNYITSNGPKTYRVYGEYGEVGSFEGVLVYSIDEILDRFNMTGSLTFDRNSSTPINVNYYSGNDKIYLYEPDDISYESSYNVPVAITYNYKDANGMTTSETVVYEKNVNDNVSYYIPECKDMFAGWFMDEELTKPFNFQKEQTLKSNINLYAKQITKTSNIHTESVITKINYKSYIYSTVNTTVEVFVYGDDIKYEINGEKYNSNQKIVLDIDAYTLYEINVDGKYDASIIFSDDSEKASSKVKVNVSEKSFKEFKLNGSVISNYALPKVEGYELQGWYDERGNLVIDKYGNVYKYQSTKVYAKWVYVG